MSAETRSELLKAFEELGSRYPEMRLGQLVVFVARLARGPSVSAVYDAEDEELLREARSALEEAVVTQP
jgi:hypothetical protein